jgi:hypothetical protein
MKPFLQGKKSLDVDPLRPPGRFTATVTPTCAAHANGGGDAVPDGAGAQVEVVKEGGKVVRLIVTCVCGERVEIECLYTAGR